jgi:hypothetical protein
MIVLTDGCKLETIIVLEMIAAAGSLIVEFNIDDMMGFHIRHVDDADHIER